MTKTGREWLARPPAERIRPILDFVRFELDHAATAGSTRGRLRLVSAEAQNGEADIDDDGFDDFDLDDFDDDFGARSRKSV